MLHGIGCRVSVGFHYCSYVQKYSYVYSCSTSTPKGLHARLPLIPRSFGANLASSRPLGGSTCGGCSDPYLGSQVVILSLDNSPSIGMKTFKSLPSNPHQTYVLRRPGNISQPSLTFGLAQSKVLSRLS